MDQEIKRLKIEIEKGRELAKQQGKHLPFWPKSLKQKIVESWGRSGMSKFAFAKIIGVGGVSLTHWCQGKGLEPHSSWNLEKEKEIKKDVASPGKVQPLPIMKESAFLTFDILAEEKESQGTLGDLKEREEHRSSIEGEMHPPPIDAFLPTGVHIQISPSHPDLESILSLLMNKNLGR